MFESYSYFTLFFSFHSEQPQNVGNLAVILYPAPKRKGYLARNLRLPGHWHNDEGVLVRGGGVGGGGGGGGRRRV